MEQRLSYRTLWISDLHLGSRCSRAGELARFLTIVRCQSLYLVGDVIDLLRLQKNWYWAPEHTEVIHQIFEHVRRGAEVTFIPGNHDEAARDFLGNNVSGVEIRSHAIHQTADDRRLLITHGDEHDAFERRSPLLHFLGGKAYDGLTVINRFYNAFRSWIGLRYLPLTDLIKNRIKVVSGYLESFEESLAETARDKQCDGIVCGHVHHPRVREDEIAYYNCGDWIESCTALAEHEDGSMKILDGLEVLSLWEQAQRDLSNRELEAEPPRRLPVAV